MNNKNEVAHQEPIGGEPPSALPSFLQLAVAALMQGPARPVDHREEKQGQSTHRLRAGHDGAAMK